MIDYAALEESLQSQDKNQLAKVLIGIMSKMDDYEIVAAFGGYYFEYVVSVFSDERFLEELKAFHEKSLRGDFFDRRWEWNSKTYDQITPETHAWYQLMGHWLDAVCQGVDTRKRESTLAAFDLLFRLLDQIDNQKIIISHHSVGEENIYCKYDYRKIYSQFKP